MKFLSLNGVSILWRRIKETFARKSETVSDISRDDTTFTVTKADGTTFEFTQKDTTYDVATTASSGLMSAADKAKLNGVESGAQENVIESVSVNGTKQQVTAKGVDITVPTALSDLTDDVGYLAKESDPTVPTWAKQPQKPAYTASEVGALSADTHIPDKVSELVNDAGYLTEHQDISGIEDAMAALSAKLNALADSDDTTLDQLSEIVAYIKNNKSLIDGITTGKVSVDDIVDSLTSTATNKPLSAKQGKALKEMIDGIVVPTKVSQLTNDAGYLTEHQDISGKQDVITDLAAIRSGASLGATALQEESDPTVPAWAKASAKPTYTAAEVGALPDDTVIPSKVSQLTNDSGFITSANIPQSDWAQNDSTALDYVKNRVCYSGDPVYTVLFEYTESLSDNNQIFGTWQTQEPLTFADNNPYILSFDGDTYTGTIFNDSSYGWVAGNFHIPNSDAEDTEEPFCIIFGPNDNFASGASGFFNVNLAERYTGTIDLEFQVGESTVHKLDDKYLNGSLIKRGTGVYSVTLNGEFSDLTASGDNSVAEGEWSTASGTASHAEGSGTTASNYAAHAEGSGATASNESSHAEGSSTTASSYASHAEGAYTRSSGDHAHSEGYYTIANHRSQHVFGEYNVADPSAASSTARGTYVEIVGKGLQDSSRSNARTLDWNGNEVLAGKLTVGAAPTANMDVATKKYVDDAVAGSGSAVTYTLSITNNVITLTGSDGSASTVTLPVYDGAFSVVGEGASF